MKIYGIFEDCHVFGPDDEIEWGDLTPHFIKSFGYFIDEDNANEFCDKQNEENNESDSVKDGEDIEEIYYVMEIEINKE